MIPHYEEIKAGDKVAWYSHTDQELVVTKVEITPTGRRLVWLAGDSLPVETLNLFWPQSILHEW